MIDSFTGDFRFLSNFWPAEVEYDGVKYQSVEHAYQAAKTLDPKERAWFKNCTAGEAKKLGRKVTMRPGWDKMKLDVMYELNSEKFMRHLDLQEKLIKTGVHELVEGNNWGDKYWGKVRGHGSNHLGKILMRIREQVNTYRNAQEKQRALTASLLKALQAGNYNAAPSKLMGGSGTVVEDIIDLTDSIKFEVK